MELLNSPSADYFLPLAKFHIAVSGPKTISSLHFYTAFHLVKYSPALQVDTESI